MAVPSGEPASSGARADDDADAVVSTDWQNFRGLLLKKHVDSGLGGSDALLSTEAVYSALRMVVRLQNDFELLHRPHGLTWAGFRVLNTLWVCGPSEVRDIARHMGVKRPSVSSAISTLEQSGAVRRERQTLDKRLVVVAMTDAGEKLFGQAVQRQFEQQAAWLDVLDASELKVLVGLLNRVLDQPPPGDAASLSD